MPIPSISHSIKSPEFITLIPAGEPVKMISPGSRDMFFET
jgi:hypothetical protein